MEHGRVGMMLWTGDDIVGLFQQPTWTWGVKSEPADTDDTSKGGEVDHPNHYNAGRFEAIDVIEDTLTQEEFRGFCLGNVMKYVMRARHKGGLTDLRKAEWYMRRLIEHEEAGNGARPVDERFVEKGSEDGED